MDLPPFRSKPAIPSHLTNEPSPLGVTANARDKKERDSLYAQIQNSNRGCQVVNFDEANEYFPELSTSAKMDGSNCREKYQIRHSEIDVEEHNEGATKRTLLVTSRA